jgi:hypothetical protein
MIPLGKLLLACNLVVLGLLATNLALGTFLLDTTTLEWALVAIYGGISAISAAIFFLVLRTYHQFREPDLLMGTVGFGIVFLTHGFTLVTLLLNWAIVWLEAAINVVAAVGYAAIVLSCGWLK